MQDDGEEEPITLYFWPTPNGLKISIMLEELAVPYRFEFIDLSKGAQFAPEFLAISPNNKMPAIVDPDGPDGQPLALFEIRRHSAISRAQIRCVLSFQRTCQSRR